MAASYSAGVDSGCAFIHADFSDSYLKIDSIKKSLRRSPSRTELPSVGDMKSGAAQKDDHLRVLATPRFVCAVFRQRVVIILTIYSCLSTTFTRLLLFPFVIEQWDICLELAARNLFQEYLFIHRN